MKTIDVAEATDTLSDYARKGLKEAVVVTRRGKPLLALTPIRLGEHRRRHQPEVPGDHRALPQVPETRSLHRGDASPSRPRARGPIALDPFAGWEKVPEW